MNTALVIAPSGDPSMSHAQAASALLAEWLGDDQQANATSSFSARARAAQKVVAALRETTAKLREQQQQQQQNREDAATATILKIFIKNIKTCTPTAPLTPLQDVVMNQVAILVKTLLLEQADYSASEEVLHEFLEATFKYASSRVTRASTIEAFGAFPTDERSAKRIAQSSLTDVEACVRSAAAAVTQTTTNTSACMVAGNDVVENMQRAFASALCLEAPRLPKRTQGDDTTAGSSSSSSSSSTNVLLSTAFAGRFLDTLFPPPEDTSSYPSAMIKSLRRLSASTYYDAIDAPIQNRDPNSAITAAARGVGISLAKRRLQSHWGHAGQTLTTLETRIRAVIVKSIKDEHSASGLSNSHVSRSQMIHMLACTELLDSLERAAALALGGRLPDRANARACHFFRANDAAFQAFLSRTRKARATLASAAGAAPAAARHNLIRLHQAQKAAAAEVEAAQKLMSSQKQQSRSKSAHRSGRGKQGSPMTTTPSVLSRPAVLLRRADTSSDKLADTSSMIIAPSPSPSSANVDSVTSSTTLSNDDSSSTSPASASPESIWASAASALAEAGDFDGLDGLARYTEDSSMAFGKCTSSLASLARAGSRIASSGACAVADLTTCARDLSDIAPACAALADRLAHVARAVSDGWPGEGNDDPAALATAWHAAPLDHGMSRTTAASVCAWRCALQLSSDNTSAAAAKALITTADDDNFAAAGVEPLASSLRVLLAATPPSRGEEACVRLLNVPTLGDACLCLARAARRVRDVHLARAALDAAAARAAHLAPAISYERAKLRQVEVPLAGRQTITALAAGAHIDKTIMAMPLEQLAVESAVSTDRHVGAGDNVAGVAARAWLRLSRWSAHDSTAAAMTPSAESPLDVASRACRTCPSLAKAWRAHARLSFDASLEMEDTPAAGAHRRAAAVSYAAYLALAPTQGGGASADASAAEACLRLLELIVGTSGDASAAEAAAEHVLRLPLPPAPWSRVVPQLFARARHVTPDGASMDALRRVFRIVAEHNVSAAVYGVVRATAADIPASSSPSPENGGAASATSTPDAFAQWAASDLAATPSGKASLEAARRFAESLHSIVSFVDERARVALKRVLAESERRCEEGGDDGVVVARTAGLANRLRSLVPKSPACEREKRFVAVYGDAINAAAAALEDGGLDTGSRLSPLRAVAKSLGIRSSTRHAAATDDAPSTAQQQPTILRRTPSAAKSLDDATTDQTASAPSDEDADNRAYFERNRVTLADVSPSLVDWESSVGIAAPMPASRGVCDATTTVVGMAPELTILAHAKTRPRKLQLLGSDGVTRTFLLKGSEDLRLDERVSHFFEVAQTALDGDREARRRGLAVRRYGVVPLGWKVGVLEWAGDRAEPLYQLFQAWQSRRRELARYEGASIPPVASARPNERFFQVVAPLMQRHLKSASAQPPPRHEWPAEMLDAAYRTLASEAPHSLLEHAVAEDASSAADWCLRASTLARSMGGSAALSYAIGLGDRHLSNILYDRRTSELVQIDYNVCFDKGWGLAVPETVPFRLTPVFVRALGPLGASNGTFRAALAHALRTSRARAGLLGDTLRGCFESDPLPSFGRNGDSSSAGGGYSSPDASTMLSRAAAKLAGLAPPPWDCKSHGEIPRADDDFARASWLISLATDERRLAAMFEGWSAWV